MVLWGGLRPIASRVMIDAATIAVWTYGALLVSMEKPVDQKKKKTNDKVDVAADDDSSFVVQSYILILFSCIVAIVTAGNLTNRWSLTLPMVPFLVLQGVRRLLPRYTKKDFTWLRVLHDLVTLLSVVCIVAAIALCLLFPAVELPPVEGPYNVGKVDLFLPMTLSSFDKDTSSSRAVWVRLLYPTLQVPQALPYLTPVTALEYCLHSMMMGAPPPLKKLDWILHTWRLTERWERNGATLAPPPNGSWPVVVHSHGLGGHADIYSYQTHSLAAQGNVVLTITHADGSSPVVNQPDGSKVEFDYSQKQFEEKYGYSAKVVEMRRNQTEWRVQEVVAATQALARWNEQDIHQDLSVGSDSTTALSIKGRLDLKQITWMGHSFGAATVLTAAYRFPDLVHTVVAHEPAIDWAHPTALSSLFAQTRIANLTHASTYNAALLGEPNEEDDSIHDSANFLLLFSHQWVQKSWAHIPLIREMYENNRLGSKKRNTHFVFDYVPGMHHNEFSDTSMLTPTWLARDAGLTGPRSPLDTAKEVAEKTRAFLELCRNGTNQFE